MNSTVKLKKYKHHLALYHGGFVVYSGFQVWKIVATRNAAPRVRRTLAVNTTADLSQKLPCPK